MFILTETAVKFPILTGKQAEGLPMQVKLASIRQRSEQPSPLLVLLSSHSFPPLINPSPHWERVHNEGTPWQAHED